MNNSNLITYILKGISLLILDAVTFMLVFSKWALLNINLFPWAFCMIMFSLVLVNAAVLASKRIVGFAGAGVYAPLITCTILYYLFIMIFTGIAYIAITAKIYLIISLIVTLIYIAAVSGLYVSGINRREDMEKQEFEKAMVMEVTLQLLNIGESIKSCRDFVEKTDYDEMTEAFDDMNERLRASTPFGRIAKSLVLSLENDIISKLSEITNETELIKASEENQKSCKIITNICRDVKALIINREKVIVH